MVDIFGSKSTLRLNILKSITGDYNAFQSLSWHFVKDSSH